MLQVYRETAARPGALKAMVNYYRALGRGGGGARQRARGYPLIDIPTLLLWGEEDVALCRETTYGTEAYVPNLTLRYLPRVSHWVQQEAPEDGERDVGGVAHRSARAGDGGRQTLRRTEERQKTKAKDKSEEGGEGTLCLCLLPLSWF